jgi:hypothetical protein
MCRRSSVMKIECLKNNFEFLVLSVEISVKYMLTISLCRCCYRRWSMTRVIHRAVEYCRLRKAKVGNSSRNQVWRGLNPLFTSCDANNFHIFLKFNASVFVSHLIFCQSYCQAPCFIARPQRMRLHWFLVPLAGVALLWK